MPRVARVAPKENIYHVLTRGNNRQSVFEDEEDYRRYLDVLIRYKERYLFKLYHYVLMTNHTHLVLETTEEGGNLSEIMKGINLVYAQYFKRRYGHVGHFWQDRYKSILVSDDKYLLACGSYVELNPVRAGLVKDPGEYKWSSYRALGYCEKDGLVDKHNIYEGMAGSQEERLQAYRDFVLQMLKERDGMRREMDGRMVYGSESFIKEIAERHSLEEVIKPRGRQVGWRKNK